MPHSEITQDLKRYGPLTTGVKIGNRIRAARTKAGMSQAELSKNCRMTARNLRYIESGQRNFFEGTVFLLRLAASLGISLRELLEGTHVPLGPLGEP